MWGTRVSFLPAAAMVVMVAVGCWSLGHVSTVGIVYVFYCINLFFGCKYLCQHKIYSPCLDRVDRFYSIRKYTTFIPRLFRHKLQELILYQFWQSPIGPQPKWSCGRKNQNVHWQVLTKYVSYDTQLCPVIAKAVISLAHTQIHKFTKDNCGTVLIGWCLLCICYFLVVLLAHGPH